MGTSRPRVTLQGRGPGRIWALRSHRSQDWDRDTSGRPHQLPASQAPGPEDTASALSSADGDAPPPHQARRFLTLSHREPAGVHSFTKAPSQTLPHPFPQGGPQVCTLPAGRPAGVHSFTGSPQVCLSHKSWTASSSSLPVYPKSLWKLAFNSRHFVLNNHGRNCTTHRSAGRGNFLRGKPSWDFLFTKPPAPTAPGCIVPHPTEDHFQT